MNFFKKILNIIGWVPIIWEDRNDDFSSIDIILYHKLKNMYNYSKNNDVNYPKLRWALNLFHNLINNHYYKERNKYFKYKTKISFGKNNKHLLLNNFKHIIKKDKLEEYVKNNKSYWNKSLKEYHNKNFKDFECEDKIYIAIKINTLKENRARELAYKILKEYHIYWWD